MNKPEIVPWSWLPVKERKALEVDYQHYRHELLKERNGVPRVVEPVEVAE